MWPSGEIGRHGMTRVGPARRRVPELTKRAYLARFLVNIEVPEEMFADEVVVEVFQQYKELQASFKEIHKTCDKLRSNSLEPSEIKREIQQLEEEKEQLNTKIAKIKQRVQAVENFDALFEVTSALRREQEEEARLAESLSEQQQLLMHAEQKYKRTLDQCKEEKNRVHDESALQLLDKLESEVRMNKERVEETMVRDVEEKRRRVKQMQEVRQSASVSESDIQQVQAAIRQLTQEIAVLTERQAKTTPNDDKLAMFRQQAAVVAKKKQERSEKLKILEEERNLLRAELGEKEEACEGIKGSKFLKGEEFKKYANSLRGKGNQYKKLKSELAEMRAEWGVLNRTEQLLKSRESNLKDFLLSVEKSKGVVGYSETQQNLEKVSALKNELDEEKGKTLEEISRVVTEINSNIKDRKSKLAPQIKELRSIRQKFQELEAEYLEKKTAYETTAVGLESERSKTESEIQTLREECAREESRYHYLGCLGNIADVGLGRVVDGKGKGALPAGKAGAPMTFSAWRDVYSTKIQQQENLSKVLTPMSVDMRHSHAVSDTVSHGLPCRARAMDSLATRDPSRHGIPYDVVADAVSHTTWCPSGAARETEAVQTERYNRRFDKLSARIK